ncbi:MAG: hypothetical protein GF331_18045 [Chitinivibrionales bacterium]|nr:hypothetical protein [Chitinivibrionales bacterium]
MLKPLKWYRSLSRVKDRVRHGAFVVEGPRAVEQVVRCAPERLLEVVIAEGVDVELPSNVPIRRLEPRQFAGVASSRTPQGVLAVVSLPSDVAASELPPGTGGDILLCEDVQDPGNIGNLVRCAAAFGFGGVILSETCADPFGPKAVQASAGTVVTVWVRRTAEYLMLTQQLKERGHVLVATDTHGEERWSPEAGTPLIVAVGSEGSGLSEALLGMADTVVRIPFDSSRAESLNVASAGAICMHAAFVRRRRE